jgi:G:T-mismatch repair DNA endonuclease (very short patch repair protein)
MNDKVQCQICKKWFKQINGHLVKHNITIKEYKEMFPLAPLTCESLKNDMKGENNPMYGKTGKNNSFYGKKHTNKTKSIISTKNTGKKRSKETQQKISNSLNTRNRFKNLFKQIDLYIDLSLGKAIQCEICGEILQQLSKHLVYKHNITIEEYKKLYPNTLTIAPSVSKVMAKANVEKWKDDNYKKNIADQNRISTIKQLAENPVFFDTKIELKIQEILTKHGYKYVTHQACCNVCLPDLMFPERKIAIFCDGDYWHNLPNYIKRDKNQDRILLKNGWIPLRFWEHEINDNIEKCLREFELEYWGKLPHDQQSYEQNKLSNYY